MKETMTTTSYDRLLSTINKRRTPAERIVCDCGKEIFTKQLEKHKETSLHHILMFKKQKKTQG